MRGTSSHCCRMLFSISWHSVLLRAEGGPANTLEPQEILLHLMGNMGISGKRSTQHALCRWPQPSASRPVAGLGLRTRACRRDFENHSSVSACFAAQAWNADRQAQTQRSERKGISRENVWDTWAGRRCTSPSSRVSVSRLHTSCAACLHFGRHTYSLTSKVLSFSLLTLFTLLNQLFSFLTFSLPEPTSLGLGGRRFLATPSPPPSKASGRSLPSGDPANWGKEHCFASET